MRKEKTYEDKGKTKAMEHLFAMVLAMIMVANMALPTVVFASGVQDKTEETSGKITKRQQRNN